MATKKITIRSNFHKNLSVKVALGPDGVINPAQITRIQRGLCSGGGCLCGGLSRSTIEEGGSIEFCGSSARGDHYRYTPES